MKREYGRALRRAGAVVCTAALAMGLGATARADTSDDSMRVVRARAPGARATARPVAPPFPSGTTLLTEDRDAPGVIAHPPRAPRSRNAAAPVTVMLHGMCDEPENECPYFESSTTGGGWLLCPRASLRCEGGGSIWSFKRSDATVEAAVTRVAQEWPGAVDDSRRTLIGFSLGAIRGMDLLHRGEGRWQRAVLIGAKIFPDAKLLRAAGVERLVLAAGDRDMMKWQMAGQAARLARHDFPVAFVSLGDIGHWFPRDLHDRLIPALAWLNGDDGALTPRAAGELVHVPPTVTAGVARETPRRAE